jgi:AraC family transcriptional regulator of adaptative response / DNA-3-methyladenine glycosylase II
VFALSPRELRVRSRRGDHAEESGALSLRLPYRAPLDGDGLIAFLGLRAVPGIEEVHDGAYRRSLRLPQGSGVVELRPADGYVHARYWLEDLRDLAAAMQRSRALLDLDSDPLSVTEALGGDALLGPLVRSAPGRRVPGHVDGHELAVRAVLGQQVSIAGARTLAGRLVSEYGQPLGHPIGEVTHVFPSIETLAAADPERLAMPTARRRALLGLAEALTNGELTLDAGSDRGETRRRLLALPGIGPWTTEYIAMRAMRDPDAFLPSDLGVRHALEQLGEDGRPAAAQRLAEHWRPYRAYALQHLWASLSPHRAQATTTRPSTTITPGAAERLAA